MIYCYTGEDYVRYYLPTKDKRLVWKAFWSDSFQWVDPDMSDLRSAYIKLFTRWNDPMSWDGPQVAYRDDMY